MSAGGQPRRPCRTGVVLATQAHRLRPVGRAAEQDAFLVALPTGRGRWAWGGRIRREGRFGRSRAYSLQFAGGGSGSRVSPAWIALHTAGNSRAAAACDLAGRYRCLLHTAGNSRAAAAPASGQRAAAPLHTAGNSRAAAALAAFARSAAYLHTAGNSRAAAARSALGVTMLDLHTAGNSRAAAANWDCGLCYCYLHTAGNSRAAAARGAQDVPGTRVAVESRPKK